MKLLIRTSGAFEWLPDDEPLPMRRIAELIAAPAGLDVVRLWRLGDPLHVMVVDDQGYETQTIDLGGGHFRLQPTAARKPANPGATALYWLHCQPGTTHEIVGDVVIVPDGGS